MKDFVKEVNEEKIIAILRKIPKEKLMETVEALYQGGIRILEITFDQAAGDHGIWTMDAIRSIQNKYGSLIRVGAGTVMTVEQVEMASAGGAEFILTPNVDASVIKRALELDMEVIAGAMTPSEIAEAYRLGSVIVKLFPAGNLGMEYCKAIMAPINHVPMIAVGGIDENNLKDYIKAGFSGVGIGSALTDKNLIKQGNFDQLRKKAERYIAIVRGGE